MCVCVCMFVFMFAAQAQLKCTKLENELEKRSMEVQTERRANTDVFAKCRDLEDTVCHSVVCSCSQVLTHSVACLCQLTRSSVHTALPLASQVDTRPRVPSPSLCF